jgi:hypothetical protein
LRDFDFGIGDGLLHRRRQDPAALLIERNTRPSVMPAAAVHASTAAFTQAGTGTVRT